MPFGVSMRRRSLQRAPCNIRIRFAFAFDLPHWWSRGNVSSIAGSSIFFNLFINVTLSAMSDATGDATGYIY
jgi:hypothetical protein